MNIQDELPYVQQIKCDETNDRSIHFSYFSERPKVIGIQIPHGRVYLIDAELFKKFAKTILFILESQPENNERDTNVISVIDYSKNRR